MKRILIFLLMISAVLIFGGCSNKNVDTDNKEEVKKFDDLTMTRSIGTFSNLWIDLPSWREENSENCITISNQNYYIITVISEEDYTFDELYNNEIKVNLSQFVDRGTYSDFAPNKDEVILSNGINAVKFDSNLSMDSYGTLYEYPAYGYYFKYENYPIMVMFVDIDTTNNEEKRNDIKKYVDEMVQTIRHLSL